MEDHASVRWDYWVPSDYWREPQAAAVEPWQACALSVDIEPKSMTAGCKDYSIGPFVKAMWDPGQKKKTLHEFKRRLSLLNQGRNDMRFFTLREDGKLYLHEVVAWMKAKGIQDFPLKLAELDAKPKDLADWTDIRTALDSSETDTYRRLPQSSSVNVNAATVSAVDPVASETAAIASDNQPEQRITAGRGMSLTIAAIGINQHSA